jgi:gas vesicle protein
MSKLIVGIIFFLLVGSVVALNVYQNQRQNELRDLTTNLKVEIQQMENNIEEINKLSNQIDEDSKRMIDTLNEILLFQQEKINNLTRQVEEAKKRTSGGGGTKIIYLPAPGY